MRGIRNTLIHSMPSDHDLIFLQEKENVAKTLRYTDMTADGSRVCMTGTNLCLGFVLLTSPSKSTSYLPDR